MFLLLLEGMCFRIMVIRFGAHVFQFPFTFIAIISAFEILMTWYSFISFNFSLIDYGTKIRIFLSLASSFYEYQNSICKASAYLIQRTKIE